MVGSILKKSLYILILFSIFVVIGVVLKINFKFTFLLFIIMINYIMIRINVKKKDRKGKLSEFSIDHGYGKHEDLFEYHRIMSVKYYSDYK